MATNDEQTDEQKIVQLFADGDRALMAGEVAELTRIYAEDYAQYDEHGRNSTRQDLIRNLSSGKIRFITMRSTGRSIHLLQEDIAVVHGSEEDEIEQDGLCSSVRYLYMDVVRKRDGKWQIVASQLVKMAS